jgi:hypothetical protein
MSYPISGYKNHVRFVQLMGRIGWFGIFIFILSQIWVTAISPIVIILSLLYSLYGIIVHPIKHKMFYLYKSKTNVNGEKQTLASKVFIFITPVAFFTFIIISVFASIKGNNLHQLNTEKEYYEPNKIISQEVFENALVNKIREKANTDSTVYFIASYGGGLMANSWNNLVLDSLQKRGILDYTVAMSGVSGGAMGQGLYSAIYKNRFKYASDSLYKNHKTAIDTMIKSNFLSLDLAWMFGWDFIREWVPSKRKFERNRARKSMEMYANLIKDSSIYKKTFKNYWAELFIENEYYPALIVNSTSSHSTRGIAFPVALDNFEQAFPNADDILSNDSEDSSLTYADALSTTNRFPFLSPAAKVEKHGHYVVGGYFENSGMLSLMNYYKLDELL